MFYIILFTGFLAGYHFEKLYKWFWEEEFEGWTK